MGHVFVRAAFWLMSITRLFMNTAVPAQIVDLGYAKYQGSFDAQENITSFLGIRYAAAPIGNLRFQAPQPPIPVSGVQPATENPNMCYQSEMGLNMSDVVVASGGKSRSQIPRTPGHLASGMQFAKQNDKNHRAPFNLETQTTVQVSQNACSAGDSATVVASEDCLFLNVFVPGMIPKEPVNSGGLPVLLYIHGGAYQGGHATAFNGADLVADSQNTVLVVVIQYRLGVFGFLSGSEVKENGALNAGLLDQRFALQWIQDHIASFGGDKSHVTIWGESAGGGSVLQHIVADGGNTQPPLFNAAIVSSVCIPSQYNYDHWAPRTLYDAVVSMTGCASSADTFACLQSVDIEVLQLANCDISQSSFYGTVHFLPVVDGTFILERPTITLAKGQVNGKVLLAVANQNEGNGFVRKNETSFEYFLSRLYPDMTSARLREAARVYQDYGTVHEQTIVAKGDSIFVCPTYYLLEAFAGRSWKGLFAIPPAAHGQDISYYFSSYSDSLPRFNNTQLITAFSQSFMSLAKYFDVNVKFDPTNITPGWDMYDVEHTEMLFNRTETDEPVVSPIRTDPRLLERCAFWRKVSLETAQ